VNGAEGISDTEGQAATGSGERTSFKSVSRARFEKIVASARTKRQLNHRMHW